MSEVMNPQQISDAVDKIASKLPAEWKPVVNQYGPAFVAMTQEEIWAWISLAAKGDAYEAHRAMLAKLPNADLLAEWTKVNDAWAEQNKVNASRIAWQKDALSAIMKVAVGMALTSVGL